jgi:hypothetical protein
LSTSTGGVELLLELTAGLEAPLAPALNERLGLNLLFLRRHLSLHQAADGGSQRLRLDLLLVLHPLDVGATTPDHLLRNSVGLLLVLVARRTDLQLPLDQAADGPVPPGSLEGQEIGGGRLLGRADSAL